MRVPLKITMMAALLVVVSASSSWALIETYLPGGAKVELKFIDYDEASLYSGMTPGLEYIATTDPRWGTGTFGDISTLGKNPAYNGNGDGNVLAGDDTWGIFKLTSIVDLSTNNNLWTDGMGGIEITGIFWGEQDTSVLLNGTTQITKGNGLQYAFFEDAFTAASRFNSTAGPAGRVDIAGTPNYATATDGTLIWTGNSVTGVAAASPYEFVSSYTPGSGIAGALDEFDDGSGQFVGNLGPNDWGTGSLNSELGSGPGTVDMRFTFKATNEPPTNGWLLRSNDPVTTYVTPELSTSWLMLLGMVPVGMAWRRRKRS